MSASPVGPIRSVLLEMASASPRSTSMDLEGERMADIGISNRGRVFVLTQSGKLWSWVHPSDVDTRTVNGVNYCYEGRPGHRDVRHLSLERDARQYVLGKKDDPWFIYSVSMSGYGASILVMDPAASRMASRKLWTGVNEKSKRLWRKLKSVFTNV